MAITGGDLVANAAVGAPHPKPLRVIPVSQERLHGDLGANSQVGRPRPEPVSIVLADGTDLTAFIASMKAYVAAHP